MTALLWAALLTWAAGAAPAAAAAPGPGTVAFRIADARITEASGIAAGRVSPGVLYVQNDSGDTNRFFALDAATGTTAATITVDGARNVDWEDIATGRGTDGRPYVWLADIGDNAGTRDEVQVYRVPEPHLSASGRDRRLRTGRADVWRLRYPDGPVDAESLAVAPDGSAYIFTKSPGVSRVYQLPAQPDAERVQLLRRVGQVLLPITGTPNPFGVAGQLTATGATIAGDGTLLAVRTYADAYVWRLTGAGVAAAIRHPAGHLALPRQPQGEGICVRGGRLLLSSEGEHSAVLAVALPAAVRPAPGSSATRSERPPASTPAPAAATSRRVAAHPERGTSRWLVVVLVVGAVVGAVAASLATWRLRSRHRR